MNKPTSKSNERPMVSEELQVQNTEQEQSHRPENGNTRRWWITGPRHTTVDDRGPRDSSRDYRRARGTTEDHGGESMAVVRQPAPAGGLPPPASIPAQSPEGVDCAYKEKAHRTSKKYSTLPVESERPRSSQTPEIQMQTDRTNHKV